MSPDLDPNPLIERLARRASHLTSRAPKRIGPASSPMPGVFLLEHREPTRSEGVTYNPLACLILRGRKEASFAGRTVRVRAGEVLLVSHDVPIVARVLEAPYLALVFELDLNVLRSLYEEIGDAVPPESEANTVQVARAPAALIEAFERQLAVVDSAPDARVLGPMLRRELHYRLLLAPFGAMLRNLIHHDSHASAIARAIAILRRDFRKPIEISRLARDVGMSTSAFHKHFKDVTSVSPLQYQKGLRLAEAQRALATRRASVSSVAYDVGYESPTQFSREYARHFGHPPSATASAAREGGGLPVIAA